MLSRVFVRFVLTDLLILSYAFFAFDPSAALGIPSRTFVRLFSRTVHTARQQWVGIECSAPSVSISSLCCCRVASQSLRTAPQESFRTQQSRTS